MLKPRVLSTEWRLFRPLGPCGAERALCGPSRNCPQSGDYLFFSQIAALLDQGDPFPVFQRRSGAQRGDQGGEERLCRRALAVDLDGRGLAAQQRLAPGQRRRLRPRAGRPRGVEGEHGDTPAR